MKYVDKSQLEADDKYKQLLQEATVSKQMSEEISNSWKQITKEFLNWVDISKTNDRL